MYGYNQFNQFSQYGRQEIIHVNGENGARAYQMMPNSNALLLDDTEPIVWLAQTDGAGYKTLKPYKITPYEPEKPADIKSLETRIEKLEETINANIQSNKPDDQQTREPEQHTKSNITTSKR